MVWRNFLSGFLRERINNHQEDIRSTMKAPKIWRLFVNKQPLHLYVFIIGCQVPVDSPTSLLPGAAQAIYHYVEYGTMLRE